MLDAERRKILANVVDSLPLADRQRTLATETIDNMMPEQADHVASLFQTLKDSMPAARSAIDDILETGSSLARAVKRPSVKFRFGAEGSFGFGKAAAISKGAIGTVNQTSIFGNIVKARKGPPGEVLPGPGGIVSVKKRAPVADPFAGKWEIRNGARIDAATVHGIQAQKVATLLIEEHGLVGKVVMKPRRGRKNSQIQVEKYSGEVRGHPVEVYFSNVSFSTGRHPTRWTGMSVVAMVLDGDVAYIASAQDNLIPHLNSASPEKEKAVLENLIQIVD